MRIETFIVGVLVLLITGGWGYWSRSGVNGPGWYGGTLLWFVVVLIMILWLLGVPIPMLKG